ncbi:MAG: NACHT domain-containing protein, partial [bacterium]|nr:NACHT domain-containing protein [bacterium]
MTNLWIQFIAWVDSLGGREAAILGAIALAAVSGVGKYVVLPLSKWAAECVTKNLFPIFSGLVFLDRIWSLPKYLQSVEDYSSRLINPWLEEGVRLTDIFVPVTADTAAAHSERIDVKQVFAMHEKVVIIGDPGSGKSTALKAIAIECIHRRKKRRKGMKFVPVYIELRRLAESGLSLADYVLEVFKQNGFPRPGRTVKRLQRKGQVAYLLDALDEVDEENHSRIVREVRSLIENDDSGERCRFILTSRPVGYSDQLRDLVDETYQMGDFTPADIRSFIRNWEFRLPKSQENLLQILADRPPIQDICRNPLMLTIVTSLYKETDYTLPDSRDEFFRVCINALLRRWDEAKNLDERNKYPPGLKEAFLQKLAFESLSDGYLPLDEASLLNEGEVFFQGRKQTYGDVAGFLDEIVRSGLLGRLPTGEMYFAHKTLAESLAASHLRARYEVMSEVWNNAPGQWLEVCSLLVSDPRCPAAQIDKLLETSRDRRNWSDLLTLAGEAHVCPGAFEEWIANELLTDRRTWQSLTRRAITGLSRLGESTRQLLIEMLAEGSDSIRQKTIYVLGLSREQWAVEAVVETLTGEFGDIAVDPLASMGNDAVAIIYDLLESSAGDTTVEGRCIAVADKIGSPQAIETTVPLLLKSRSRRTRFEAARVIAGHLSDERNRHAFEVRLDAFFSAYGYRLSPSNIASGAWGAPWIEQKHLLLREFYMQLIEVLAEPGEEFPTDQV